MSLSRGNISTAIYSLHQPPWCHHVNNLFMMTDENNDEWLTFDIELRLCWKCLWVKLITVSSKWRSVSVLSGTSHDQWEGQLTCPWPIRSWKRGCFCTMYNSRDWRGDVGITEWLSGLWMTPGIWSDHVWCEHVTVSQSAVPQQLSHNDHQSFEVRKCWLSFYHS